MYVLADWSVSLNTLTNTTVTVLYCRLSRIFRIACVIKGQVISHDDLPQHGGSILVPTYFRRVPSSPHTLSLFWGTCEFHTVTVKTKAVKLREKKDDIFTFLIIKGIPKLFLYLLFRICEDPLKS